MCASGEPMPVSSPPSGAVVMGTGIVSIALLLDHRQTLGRALLVLTASMWIGLAISVLRRARRDLPRLLRDAGSPLALTWVAASAVLGSGMIAVGWSAAGAAMLVIGLVLWLAVLVPVLANWTTPTTGGSLLLPVSTEALAATSASLAAVQHAAWLLDAALAACVLGLASYLFVMASFDRRQLAVGRGDHWITGGALAVSTLAAAQIVLSARSLHDLPALVPALKTALLALWPLTIAWLVVLLAVELLHLRPRYDARRWSTVFPVGMYAACSFAAGRAIDAGGLSRFAQVWVWVAAVLWAVVLAATINSARRRERPGAIELRA